MGQYVFSGRVMDLQTGKPVAGAYIKILESEIQTTADGKGMFQLTGIPAGIYSVQVSYLDYVNSLHQISIVNNVLDTILYLHQDNLLLENVQVNSKLNHSISTTLGIDRKSLDHLQMLSITDAAALLPGGKTNRTLYLTQAAQNFAVNGFATESGNPLFGVGIEVDGIRLSPNASLDRTPIDLRNIASSNVESIDVIVGVPSVEYGDITNGLVKINTRKGASPYIIEAITKPNTRQVALSKGWLLPSQGGVLNFNGEHTRSVSNLTSPYTDYVRNGISLHYENTFNKAKQKPLVLNLGITGNIGGRNTEDDPDLFTNTYTKEKDNVLRGNLDLQWLLKKRWITNLTFSGGFHYNDKLYEKSQNKSFSASTAAIHSNVAGYFVGQTYEENPDASVILIQPGYWYENEFNDNKLFNYNLRLKGNWYKKINAASNNILVGGEYAFSKNYGKGIYYQEYRYAPTWRPYWYKDESALNNMALYLEDKLIVPIGYSKLQIVGGVRSDVTRIQGSQYGAVSGLSPRFNTQYTFWENQSRFIKSLSIRYGWGKSTKLPSFDVLYPRPQYLDILAFAPATTATGQTYYAYYTHPYERVYNPNLNWQYNIQNEMAFYMDLDGTHITVIASRNKTFNSYQSIGVYHPFTYKLTDQSALQNVTIPEENRVYNIDQKTGVVTISDKTGVNPTETLAYREFTRFVSSTSAINGSPVVRDKLSWIIDFKQIRSLRTSVRVDGNYYVYKKNDQTISGYLPNSTETMADGNPYKYIGFYTGDNLSANGENSKSVNLNVVTTTHIPQLRLLFTVRIESTLYDATQMLSMGRNGAARSFILDSRDAFLPSANQGDIYTANKFVGLYPEYYISLDNLNNKIPFAEKYLWAKDNDPILFNELSKLVIKTNTNYYFAKNRLSAYFISNIGITKEIGNKATVTFNAVNFLNNLSTVKSSANNTETTLYETSYVPSFYYGLSLRLKF